MAMFTIYRTARTPKQCEDWSHCDRGIRPGERYLRAVATPGDQEVNQSNHWRVMVICCEHMTPEPLAAAGGSP